MSQITRKLTIASAAIIVGWVGSFAVAVWATSSHTTSQLEKVKATEFTTVDHEARLRLLEAKHGEVVTDIRWIKESLIRIEKRLEGKP